MAVEKSKVEELLKKTDELIDTFKILSEDLKECLSNLRAVLDRKEVENEILEMVELSPHYLAMDDLTPEELREVTLPEYSFSLLIIDIEFTSALSKRYRARFHSAKPKSDQKRQISITLTGVDGDSEDFKHVMETFARETGSEPKHPRDMRVMFYLQTTLVPQLRVAELLERIREHFNDVKITQVKFYEILTGFKETLPERVLKRERQDKGRKVALLLLKVLDFDLKRMDEIGVEKLKDDWEVASMAADEPGTTPLWVRKLWRSNWDDKEAKMKIRKMRELYKQVLEELGFIQQGTEHGEE